MAAAAAAVYCQLRSSKKQRLQMLGQQWTY